ncbi:MAG: DUF2905 domain-containing protein [Firmicutes bacterium]|nr:DUF2905 domain-containing protein [Bacillota bacterium]
MHFQRVRAFQRRKVGSLLDTSAFSRILITTGLIIVALGLLLRLLGAFPSLGKLPGDIVIKRGNFTFYFPLATSIILSLLLSLILALFRR